jgi:hypothetical protein
MALGYGKMLYFVQHLLPGFRLTRQRNLALLAIGIAGVRDGHLTMSEIARSIPTRSDHWYKFKRIRRFLSNLKWCPAELFGDLIRYALERFYPGHYVPVIMDQSTIGGRWEVLWASLPFRGRALPIAFRLFRYADISQEEQGTQHRIEETFIRMVVSKLPKSPPSLLLFDRGYARATFFRFLDRLDVKYVVRVPKTVWVQYRHRYAGRLEGIPVARGALLWWPRTYYQKAKRYRVNLVITRNATAKEPWYLVTNLKRAASAVRWYERRFRCEELFRDLKDQLHLERVWIQQTQRMERLVFGLVVLYHALTLIGATVQQRGLRKRICKDRVSLAWLALRAIRMTWLLPLPLMMHALIHRRWSLHYESG